MPRLLIAHDDPHRYLDTVKNAFPELELFVCSEPGLEPEARRFAPQAVFSWKGKAVPAETQRSIIACPQVEWVHVAGAGFEHLMPLPDHVTVTNSSGVCSDFMAETVIGAILMWNFGFPEYMKMQGRKQWQQDCWVPLSQKTVLIIGLGSIGCAVARQAKAFGMRVLGVRHSGAPVDDVDEVFLPEQLREALSQADYVCLHIPLTAGTHHIFGRAEFERMKPAAVLVNTARGGVVDEQALADALNSERIRGAYFDVFETEPLPVDSPMWRLPNLIISPHVADSVADWQNRFAQFFLTNLGRWMNGESLLNTVDPRKGY